MSMPPIPRDLQIALEGAIDSHGLANVLDALGRICFAKAEHIREAWQDNALAGLWDTAGKAIGTVERRQSIRRVSA